MKKSFSYIIVFSGLLGVVSAGLLTGASRLTARYREANARLAKNVNILRVLGISVNKGSSPGEILKLFEQNVRVEEKDGLIFYVYRRNGKVEAVAVPFSGKGLWGPIKGLLSLAPDRETIRGICFYEQEETPGLGGEIASKWFQEQFRGKKIMDEKGHPGLKVTRSKAVGINEVDAITGATLTSRKVETMLNRLIYRITKGQNGNVK